MIALQEDSSSNKLKDRELWKVKLYTGHNEGYILGLKPSWNK